MIHIDWRAMIMTFLGGGSFIGIIQYTLQRKTSKESNELKALELQVNITEREREYAERLRKEGELKDEVISKLRMNLMEAKNALSRLARENDTHKDIIEKQKEHIAKLEAIIDEFEEEAYKLKGEYEHGANHE